MISLKHTKNSFLKGWLPFCISFVLICVLTVLVTRGLWNGQLIRSFDMEFHAARAANYYLALKGGQLPPRWAPNLSSNLGYPVFLLMYPLPYLITTVFFLITQDFQWAINLHIITSFFLALSGSWLAVYVITRRQDASFLGSILYTFSAYFLMTVYVKGAIAEALFMSLLPWVWWILLIRNNQNRWWWPPIFFGICVAFLLSHHVSAIMAIPLLVCWYIYDSWPVHTLASLKAWWQKDWRVVLIGLSAALTTLFFWLPLIAEKQFTKIDNNEMVVNYFQDFVSLTTLIWSPWGYAGFSPDVPNESFTRMVGVSIWVVVFCAVLSIFKKGKELLRTPLLFWVAVFFTSLFLMTPASHIVWKIFTPLQYMQFPWRLLWMSSWAGTLVFAYIVKEKAIPRVWLNTLAAVIVGFALLGLSWSKPIGYFSHDTYYWMEYPGSSTSFDELDSIWFDRHANLKLTRPIILLPDTQDLNLSNETDLKWGESQLISWNGSQMSYSVSLPQDGWVLQRTMYFPGWEVTVDGQPVTIEYQHPQLKGRVMFKVPAGSHQVQARFTENTSARQLGLLLSGVGLMSFVGIWFAALFFDKKSYSV